MSDIDILFKSTMSLENVGIKTFDSLKRINCYRIIDLIFHLPSNIITKELNPNLRNIENGTNVILEGKIDYIEDRSFKFSRSKPYKIKLLYQDTIINLIFFNYYPSYFLKNLSNGSTIKISGKIDRSFGNFQITHPERLYGSNVNNIEVIYPLTYGLYNKQLAKIINNAIGNLPELPEWIDNNLLLKYNWKDFRSSVIDCHNPKNYDELSSESISRLRLSYDEFLANQLYLNIVRLYRSKSKGHIFKSKNSLSKKLINNVNFELTKGQKKVLSEIIADQNSEDRMMRLLQGDVGSGKTIVALIAALNVIESGRQVAFMVPTDILANQHFNWIKEVTHNLGIEIELLTGRIKGIKRRSIFDELENGNIDLLIGTHALFQDKVNFKNLAFIIIDEQHRFGVEQRINLVQKGNDPDLLVMSATPIPRTLTLALSGDMNISRLTDKPKNRIPIITTMMSKSKIDNLIDSVRDLINNGGKAYWICPLIEEQDPESSNFKSDLAAAIKRYEEFSELFNFGIGLIHGRMKTLEKDDVMNRFILGEIKLLVSTTVIEVGIDVKDATLIVIEHAERFGLSQLHQLRGRVGRSDIQSYCILLHESQISISARAKLKIMKQTEDGFLIAEEDLKIRGAGEILGTRQSGLARFKFIDFDMHDEILEIAANDAKNIIDSDPKLISDRGRKLRILLELFQYRDQIGYLFG